MTINKTIPTSLNVKDFLKTVPERRRIEAEQIIQIMSVVSGKKPVMWGPSIIGFGKKHYKYDTGREGDTAELGFSPRKSAITIYFLEGFLDYANELSKLGKYKNSVSCLYINKLEDVNIEVLKSMIKKSYIMGADKVKKILTVEEYIASIPTASRVTFDRLRAIVKKQLPNAKEVMSYGIVGYKIDDKRARVFISGWKDHVAMYPIPKDKLLQSDLEPYIKGRGTLWFQIEKPLPEDIIKRTIDKLIA